MAARGLDVIRASIRSALDFCRQLDFAEDALHLKALLEIAFVDGGLPLRVDLPRKLLGLGLATTRGFDELRDDLVEGMNLVVVENHEPGLIDPLVRVLLFFDEDVGFWSSRFRLGRFR